MPQLEPEADYSVALTPRPSILSDDSTDKTVIDPGGSDEDNVPKRVSWYNDPSVLILVGCLLGILTGCLLGKHGASVEVISWVSLPGQLFLRALTCVVVPLVFVNIFLSVADMLETGHAAKSGFYTMGYFLVTTTSAVAFSLASTFVFKKWFSKASASAVVSLAATAAQGLQCGSDASVQWFPNGTLFCIPTAAIANSSSSMGSLPVLLVNQTAASSTTASLSRTIQDQIFRALVPDNIVQQFVAGNYLGIMAFAIFLAVCMHKVDPRPTTIVALCSELNAMLLVCIRLIIDLTPIAVFSLVAGGLGTTSDLTAAMSDVGIFLVSFLVAIFLQYAVTLMALVFLTLRRSPWQVMQPFLPAQVFAFCCASSAATLPVTLRCARVAGVPASVGSFIITMGATLHMNGTSIYFPCAIVYLAVSTGDDAKFNVASYVLLALLSMMSAIAAAPVPSAALVLVLPMYNAVCGTSTNPANFSYLLAMDFLLDRFRTWLNVSGDAVVALCVAELDKRSNASTHNVEEAEEVYGELR
ncbi:Aste57867_9246 [Aphanomyces stellatus]|uniref:Amino acid transporter n=1 Tax=Aphanomyces stellatus TaxID=120398 RepID=A0A485KMJ3_9STRA|nr:hypothetical protein As57867_009210 [Aphanomyces stellatus]VFT86129.1 Aste57867_9246 [Aphanomyces stellatus]